MKHFMFLFLFNFTSSMLTYFEIIEIPGLYVWNISEDENENPKYVKIKSGNRLKYSISELPYPYLNAPSSSSVEESDSILDTGNTYVVLKMSYSYDFYLFYWVGAQSSEEKRKNVAHFVGFILREKLLKEMPEVKLKNFHREAEGVESRFFTQLFELPPTRKKPRLYRVAGSQGQFITEAVLVWNSLYSNDDKIQRAYALSRKISNVCQNLKRFRLGFFQVIEGNPNAQQHPRYNFFKSEFLKDFEGVPETWQFPQIPVNYSDRELANERKRTLKLYAYFWSFAKVIEQPVEWEILTMDIFRQNSTYVLVDSKCGNITVILGRDADVEQFKMCLSAAEKFSRTIGVEDAWQRVKVFRLAEELPIWLDVFFYCQATK